jgi:hypothetical protein
MNDEPHVLLGAYVLGGLDADQRTQFEHHLRDCPQCRRDIVDFAPLPALLAKVDPADLATDSTDDVEDLSPNSTTVLDIAAPRRNTRRWWAIGAALAGAAAVTIGIAILTIPGTTSPPPTAGRSAVQEISGDVSGMVTMTPMPWGTAISLDIKKLPHDGVFTLRTMDDHGRMEPAANWAAMPTGAGIVHGSTSIPMPQLRRLNVVDADNRVLATMHR